MLSDKLIKMIIEKKSPIVVGLDPRLESLPKEITDKHFLNYGETFKAAAESILEFNIGIIDAVCDFVPAVKPQTASMIPMLNSSMLSAAALNVSP